MILTLVAAEEPAVGPADYLDRYFATFPSRATAAGRHDLDWELEDLTPRRRAEWLAFNRRAARSFAQALADEDLPRDDRLDAELLLRHAELELMSYEALRRPERDPLYWTGVISNATVFLLVRDDGPLEERLASAAARARLLPRLARQARKALSATDPSEIAPELCQTASRQVRGSARFYAEGFSVLAEGEKMRGRLLSITVSPRTVRKYMVPRPRRGRHRYDGQSLSTFLRNHSPHFIAADFFTVVTAKFDLLRVLIIMEIASRRILDFNVTEHPTAQWTLQQFREALPWEHDYRYLIHDRDSIFSASLDENLKAFGLEILKTPPRSPLANAHCERLIGTARRECVDHLIPLSERHLRRILSKWIEHYNRGRPHSSLGPGLPESGARPIPHRSHRRRLPKNATIEAKAILGGLHHEYRLRPAPS